MPFESLPIGVQREIDHICVAFEAAWSAGQHPMIEDQHGDWSGEARDVLVFELLKLEFGLRREKGENPLAKTYVDRFPDQAEAINTELGSADPTPLIGPLAATKPADPPVPERIGRYRVHPSGLLGQGNFRVYRARDDLLERDVAIKVARPDARPASDWMMCLARESGKLRLLNHPNIVKLLDFVPPNGFGGWPERDGFIVLQFIDGRTLESRFRSNRPAPVPLVEILAQVADALQHAHEARLVHRDLKPANILLGRDDHPYVCDFGLAVDEAIQRLRRGEVAGTPRFMAPEQVRGETPRFDGRTDIWAFGVILYYGLTGGFPYNGATNEEIFDAILNHDPRPPRQINKELPRELERICLRCLARRMNERYLTAADLAEDLRTWLSAPAPRVQVAQEVIFKGLRSFDDEDAPYFIDLLPGPRRSDGLPESLNFWKTRIQDLEGDSAFSLGLIYGPSGGGKSSFLKAGLLPNLDRQRICPITVEATPSGTEARLLAELRRSVSDLPPEIDLAGAVALLRDDSVIRPRPKILLVIEQFEQWLQSHADQPDAELIKTFRHCDGHRVSALILVRDDFWMGVTRFFQAVGVPLVEGVNSCPVEPFDARHTRNVLEKYGRALGRLPGAGEEPARFLDRAVGDLTGPEGLVIPVRLSLLTEMVRRRPWTTSTLDALGGVKGIEAKFLEESFDESGFAAPARKSHLRASQGVLRALLPARASAIRGRACSASELCEAAGYVDRPSDFDDLMRLLDRELRLVTATDPLGTPADEPGDPSRVDQDRAETHYRLAHDYLIGPVRQWVERKRQATRSGRAQLRLEAITASWVERPSSNRLPSLLEWLSILWHTPAQRRSSDERRMMRAATLSFSIRAVALLAIVAAGSFAVREALDEARASILYGYALESQPAALSGLIPDLTHNMNRLRARLEVLEVDGSATAKHRFFATVLLYRERPTSERATILRSRLEGAGLDEVEMIRDALVVHPRTAGGVELRLAMLDDSRDPESRLRSACVLAGLQSADLTAWKPATDSLTEALLTQDRRAIPRWIALLGAASVALEPSLSLICADQERDPVTRAVAAEVLAEACVRTGRFRVITASMVRAKPEAAKVLLSAMEQWNVPERSAAITELHRMLDAPPSGNGGDERAAQDAMACLALAVLHEPEMLRKSLLHRPDPGLRTHVIHKAAEMGLSPRVFRGWLAENLDASQHYSVLLAWSETNPEGVSAPIRTQVIDAARSRFLEDPDPAVHSAAALLLRRWSPNEPVLAESGPAMQPRRPEREGQPHWEPGPNGHTMAVLPGPLRFWMGATDEPDPDKHVIRHYRRIERTIAVSTTEVTVEQYRAFAPEYVPPSPYSTGPDCPAGGISWYQALRYCNWLSDRSRLQRCYPDKIDRETKLDPDAFDRDGFRLPTEAEWEYFCRGGTETARSYGDSGAFLNRYAWTRANSEEKLSPVAQRLPNPLGMYDTLGSLWEWCHDGPTGTSYYSPYPEGSMEHPAGDPFIGMPLNKDDWRYVRGGAFDYSSAHARSAFRDVYSAPFGRYQVGFRVVRTLHPDKAPPRSTVDD